MHSHASAGYSMSPGVPGRDPPGVLGLIGSTSCLLFTLFIAMQAKFKENPDVDFLQVLEQLTLEVDKPPSAGI